MSNKRVGLADRTVKPRLNVLFTPSKAEEQSEKEKEQKEVTEVTETKKETIKKDAEAKAIRQTYYMCPEIIEAIRIMDFETRDGISAIVNRILMENIPEETMEQAKKNLKRRKKV